VLPIRIIAGWRIPVTDHTKAAIQPATVQPAAKFKRPMLERQKERRAVH